MDNKQVTKGLEQLIAGLGAMQDIGKDIISPFNDPKLTEHLTLTQKELIKDATGALDLKGLSPDQMHDKMQGIMAKHGLNKFK